MYEITGQPFESYQQFKATMDQTVNSTVQNIVKIGYLLKVARDTGILQESGYTTMRDFAQAEYNIDASTASRFIGINDKYSMGGNSMELDDKYKGFEASKLVEMLTLPDSIIEEIPPEMKRDEIREIKNQLKEEQKTSDLEMYIESTATIEATCSDLTEVLKQSLEESFELFKEADRRICDTENLNNSAESLYSALAPAGYATLIGRIPGKGRVMLSIASQSEDPALINARTGEKERITWRQIFDELDQLIKHPNDKSDPEVDYAATFGHEPKKEEEKEEKKPSAVTVSKEAKPKTDKKAEKKPKKPEKTKQASPEPKEEKEESEKTEEAAGEEEPKEPTTAAGTEEKIAPAQSEEETIEVPKELTSFQKQIIDKLETIKIVVRSMEPDKDNWDHICDMLRETQILINKTIF
ncbi:MAG: hypothetical protein E7241_05180 [Lachnospiraceae bacterium]|jgi:hypothetical protein|nr:hypothetical protein [Lachnospiraceae bacterium]